MAAYHAGATPTAGTWGQAPGQALPPGWEAKYDPGQRRYFYINHSNQVTSWEDPRPAYYRQLAMQQQQHQQQQSAHRPQPSPRPSPQPSAQQRTTGQSSGQGESIPMHDLNKPTWHREVEDKYNLKVTTLIDDEEEEEEGGSAASGSPRSPSRSPRPSKTEDIPTGQTYEEKVQRLRVSFPTADETIIKQFLVKNHLSETAAARSLQSAGFQKQDAANVQNMGFRIKKDFPTADIGIIRDILHGVNNSESKARHELKSLGYQMTASESSLGKGKATARGRSSSPQPASLKPSPSCSKARTRSESPKEKSVAEKKKLKGKMAAEFPDQTSSTIDMALDVCHYDEGRARTLIQSMSTTQQAKQIVTRMGLSVDHEGRRSPSPKPSAGPSTSAPPQITFSFPESLPSTSTKTTTSSSGSSAFASSSAFSSSSSYSRDRSYARPPKTTPSSSGRVTGSVVRSQPGAYNSDNTSTTRGPDPILAIGPNKNLLIEDYASCKGPDPHNRIGRIFACGHDATLASGPDARNRCGPNPFLRQSPGTCLVSQV